MLPELAPSFAVRPRLDGLEHVVVHRRTDRCLRANSAGSVGCWTRSACGARASNCRRKWRRSRAYGIVTSYTAWFFVEDEQRRGMHTEHQTVRETSANPAVLDFSRDNHVEMKRAQTGLDAALSSRYGAGAKSAHRVGPAPATPKPSPTTNGSSTVMEPAPGALFPTRHPHPRRRIQPRSRPRNSPGNRKRSLARRSFKAARRGSTRSFRSIQRLAGFEWCSARRNISTCWRTIPGWRSGQPLVNKFSSSTVELFTNCRPRHRLCGRRDVGKKKTRPRSGWRALKDSPKFA